MSVEYKIKVQVPRSEVLELILKHVPQLPSGIVTITWISGIYEDGKSGLKAELTVTPAPPRKVMLKAKKKAKKR